MDARKLLKKYCLDIDDMPNPHSINPATIVGLDQETFQTKDDNGKPVQGTRTNLWFREFDLPLRLNNVRVKLLSEMLGHETDDWKGRQIGLLVGQVVHFGEAKKTLMIHTTPLDLTKVGGRPQIQAGTQPDASATTAKPVAFDVKPLGAKGAERLKAALKELGTTFDVLLTWLKRERPAVFDRVNGLELEDIPLGAATDIRRFLDSYPGCVHPEQPEAKDEAIKDEDIPF